MRVALGGFARSGLEARLGEDLAAGVRAALVHYTRRLRSGRKPVDLPRFQVERQPDVPAIDFELSIDPEIERVLERETHRQGTSLQQLTTHAVFVYLADLDEPP